MAANFGFDFDFSNEVEYDSYTGEILDHKKTEPNTENTAPRKGGKAGRYCGVQEHIKDAPTQAVDALNTCWELGYYGNMGIEALLLLGELKDTAECGYEFTEGPKKGDGPTWKARRLPKKDWDMTNCPSPEAFEKRVSEIMTDLRLCTEKKARSVRKPARAKITIA